MGSVGKWGLKSDKNWVIDIPWYHGNGKAIADKLYGPGGEYQGEQDGRYRDVTLYYAGEEKATTVGGNAGEQITDKGNLEFVFHAGDGDHVFKFSETGCGGGPGWTDDKGGQWTWLGPATGSFK